MSAWKEQVCCQVYHIIRAIAVVIFLNEAPLWGNDLEVTNLLDSGVGSFREALLNAEEDDCIGFDQTLSGTLTLLSQLPPLDKELIILGPSSGLVTISGNNLFPILEVGDDCIVTISDVNLTAGATGGSGAALSIGNAAEVALFNSSLTQCVALGSKGGAVHIGEDALFSGYDLTFLNNTSGGFGDDVFLSQGSSFESINSLDGGVIDVFGEGEVIKGGAAKAIFTVSESSPLIFIIERGTAVSTGVRTEPSIVFGKLMGSQTTLYIANYGVIKPGEVIGTMTTTADYYQGELATLEIAISPEANDLLQIGGHAHLSGTLSILPEVGTYQVGTTYTLLQAGGGITGAFDSVNFSSMGFDVHYLHDRVTIEITSL